MNVKLKELVSEMEELNKIETLSKEQEERYQTLEGEVTEVLEKMEAERAKDSRIGKVEELKAELDRSIEKPVKPDVRTEDEEGRAFRSFGEFVRTIRFNPNDPRLHEKREQSMDVDEEGGFLVPDEFIRDIRQLDPMENIVRPRASVIPAGAISPDATVTMPALDQTATDGTGMFGGMSFVWVTEGTGKTETDTAFLEVSLDPKEIAGYVTVTDKLLRNAPQVDGLLRKLMREGINSAEEEEFLAGTNAATRPTGIISHASCVTVNRATANSISYSDIVNMVASRYPRGNYVWVASVSAMAELMQMKNFEAADSDAPNLVWQPDARTGILGSMLGYPVLFSDIVPSLGTKGDLLLANFSYYLIKDGYGIAIDASKHVEFKANKTLIKAFWNVDGKPWLTQPLTLRDGSTEVSPFVVLDVPSSSS
jgi:HK97 family phage major capsid protein